MSQRTLAVAWRIRLRFPATRQFANVCRNLIERDGTDTIRKAK